MGEFLYRFGIWSYFLSVRLASISSSKAKSLLKGSGESLKKIQEDLKGNSQPVAWFHCASLGEFEQGRPLMEAYQEHYPEHILIITFFSPSGYENAPRISEYTYYLPKDTALNARAFVDAIKPSISIFIRYEFWFYFMRELSRQRILTLSVSSDFRTEQIFFRSYGRFYLEVIRKLNHFFVQNKESKELLATKGIDQVTVTGDTRFDRVLQIASTFEPIEDIQSFLGGQDCLVVGSAWQGDMEILYPYVRKSSSLKIIIAPHELSTDFFSEIEKKSGKEVCYFSSYEESQKESDVMIIDCIGLLSRVYGHAKYAFVGGGMGPGVHSVLEPAAYGIPVFFGNRNYERWKESVQLVKSGGGFAIGSSIEFEEIMTQLETEMEQYEGHCQNSALFIEEFSGSTEKIMAYITRTMS